MIQELFFPLISFALSALFIGVLSPIARKIGWLDKPDLRKQHDAATPLVGGLAMLLAILSTLFVAGYFFTYLPLVVAMVVLCLLGLVDDILHIRPLVRLLLQIGVSLLICLWANFRITQLGDMFGTGPVVLGDALGLIVPVFSMVAMINAINMIDGVDGLAGGLLVVTLVWLAGLVATAGGNVKVPLILGAAVGGYLCFNMRGPLRKRASVFMGDAGSTMLGAAVTWLLLCHTQPSANANATQVMPLALVPWLIAIPLMDATALIIGRGLRGGHPFKADRHHLHHLLLRAGLEPVHVTPVIITAAAVLASVGWGMWHLGAPEPVLSWGFVALFAVYYYVIHHKRQVVKWLRRWVDCKALADLERK